MKNFIAELSGVGKLIFTGGVAFVLLLILGIGLLTFTERVPEGKVAVVYTPNGGATEVLNPGWHLIGLFDKTQEYPTRITIVDTNVTATTTDGKKIDMPVKYEMKVDKAKVLKIFQELGSQDIEQIQEGYLYQKLFGATRETIAGYSVLDVFGTKTTEASAKVTEKMSERTKDLGFMVTNVTLGSPKVDKATQASIDARVKAAQENELKKLELKNEQIEAEKKAVVAKGEAEKAKIEAKGKADSALIEAEAQAKSNKEISASLTDKVLKQQELKAREKHGWATVTGASNVIVDETSK